MTRWDATAREVVGVVSSAVVAVGTVVATAQLFATSTAGALLAVLLGTFALALAAARGAFAVRTLSRRQSIAESERLRAETLRAFEEIRASQWDVSRSLVTTWAKQFDESLNLIAAQASELDARLFKPMSAITAIAEQQRHLNDALRRSIAEVSYTQLDAVLSGLSVVPRLHAHLEAQFKNNLLSVLGDSLVRGWTLEPLLVKPPGEGFRALGSDALDAVIRSGTRSLYVSIMRAHTADFSEFLADWSRVSESNFNRY